MQLFCPSSARCQTYGIDTSCAEKPVDAYPTLQAFFTRRLKPGLRPIAALNVNDAHTFWVKGQGFNVHRLMGPGYDSQDHWKQAAISINRLSPADIHRLHAAVSGRVVRIRSRGNRFMASEFAAVHSREDVMVENERLVMEFDSPEFGTVVQVMIGASEVGTVKPLVAEGQTVKKGDEVAVFEYGGSIMATLFHHDAIDFDADLHQRSRRGAETLVKYASSLGQATGRRTRAPGGAA
eukprot:gene10215-10375_t